MSNLFFPAKKALDERWEVVGGRLVGGVLRRVISLFLFYFVEVYFVEVYFIEVYFVEVYFVEVYFIF